MIFIVILYNCFWLQLPDVLNKSCDWNG